MYEVACPKCGKPYQLRRVNARARTCPACGHVWARDPATERKLGGNGSGAGGDAGENVAGAELSVAAAVVPARKAKRLGGAAAIAHAQKLRGEPVTTGRLRRGHADARPAAAASESSSDAPRPRFIDRLKRIL